MAVSKGCKLCSLCVPVILMFNDGRSKRVVFIAHCLLNQNSISDGTAVYPAAFKSTVRLLLDADAGIVQLPCPELCCLGLDRGDVRGALRAGDGGKHSHPPRDISRGTSQEAERARRLRDVPD